MKVEVTTTMAEDIQSVLNEIRERLVRVETKLDDYNGLRDKAESAYSVANNTKEKIEKLEDNQKWLLRTTIGDIIVAAVSAFIKFNV